MHFTHIRNLAGIVEDGGLHADSKVRANGRLPVSCAASGIKKSRAQTRVTVKPYGYVSDYVPFYYAPRSPMLYRISRGGVQGYTEGQSPLIYLVSTVETVRSAGLAWVGSDGNCAAATTRHYNDWDVLIDNIDWELMKTRYWANTVDDGDRMRRRAAEFLVHNFFPLDHVHAIIAMQGNIAASATQLTRGKIPVRVNSSWYF
jgi:ssDNA thymidine ADP-ribosyltransferase, DarT